MIGPAKAPERIRKRKKLSTPCANAQPKVEITKPDPKQSRSCLRPNRSDQGAKIKAETAAAAEYTETNRLLCTEKSPVAAEISVLNGTMIR